MIVLITGTPGTGKSTVARHLAGKLGYRLIRINELGGDVVVGYDAERESKILDMDKVSEQLKNVEGDVIIEGHLSHLLSFGDVIIVLRAHPDILRKRLRNFRKKKLDENLEAEALDVCLIESIKEHGSEKVFEIDTSKKKSEDVAKDIVKILGGKGEEFEPGRIDWSEEFFYKEDKRDQQ
ncbi:MAG: adenylate kinase family protein [Candidatus Hydrothermarchaeales archaeon]